MYVRSICGTLIVLAGLVCATTVRAATPVFLLDSESGISTLIFRVDPATAQLTTVGSISTTFGTGVGLAAASGDLLYVTTSSGQVLEVTASPFGVVDLGNLSANLVGLAFSFTGQLYGIDETTDELCRIEFSPLTRTVVGKIREGSISGPVVDVLGGDIAQDASGTWYLWSNTRQDLFTLDVTTAVATQLDPFSEALGGKSGLAFDYQGGGTLLASSGALDALLTLNQADGTTISSVGFCHASLGCPYDARSGDMASPHCADADGDGFSPDVGCGPVDCDDAAPAVYPSAPELCNGADDDCDGGVDEEPAASAACATSCTQTAQCVNGSCVTTPLDCSDANPCTIDSCNPTLPPAAACQHANQPDGLSCSDGNVCNGEELCSGGACQGGGALNCDDGNACTGDSCAPPNGCRNTPVPGCCTADADCQDASLCTTNERCVGGLCLSDPVNCDDSQPCTNDFCSPLAGCAHTAVPPGQSCSDLDFCNGIETCQSGVCAAGTAPGCDDGNPCTTDGCNSAVGCTHDPLPNCCFTDADCVDSDACTVNERCTGGSCVSDARNCIDANPCTADTCNPASGCVYTVLIDGTSCADGNACDGLETCGGGTCAAGAPPDCDDRNFCTTDSCDNAAGCQHVAVSACCTADDQCADSDQCTVNERCTAQHACTSTLRVCDDSNACTADSCDPGAGCVFAPLASGPCDDGNQCTPADACSTGTCVGLPLQCSDGNLCNGLETCAPATGQCSAASGPLTCTPGGGSARTCAAEWYVANPNNATGIMSTRQVCLQGDSSCDFDADPATCSFHVAVCLRVPDPRLDPPCTPTDVANYYLWRPTLTRDPATAGALLAALDTLPGSGAGVRRGRDRVFSPPIDRVRCTPEATIMVPVGRTKKFLGVATTVAGSRDVDSLRLKCRNP